MSTYEQQSSEHTATDPKTVTPEQIGFGIIIDSLDEKKYTELLRQLGEAGLRVLYSPEAELTERSVEQLYPYHVNEDYYRGIEDATIGQKATLLVMAMSGNSNETAQNAVHRIKNSQSHNTLRAYPDDSDHMSPYAAPSDPIKPSKQQIVYRNSVLDNIFRTTEHGTLEELKELIASFAEYQGSEELEEVLKFLSRVENPES